MTFYEDLEPGKRFRSSVGRTITDFDNIWFTLLTNNVNQIHFNLHFAQGLEEPFKGRLVVNGILTLAVGVGLTTEFTTKAGGVMLGLEDVKFLRPVFPGDTLYAEAEVVERRVSKSRPSHGIVKLRTKVYNQRGEEVLRFTRTVMVPRRMRLKVGEESED